MAEPEELDEEYLDEEYLDEEYEEMSDPAKFTEDEPWMHMTITLPEEV